MPAQRKTHKDLLNDAGKRKRQDNLFMKGIVDGKKQLEKEEF